MRVHLLSSSAQLTNDRNYYFNVFIGSGYLYALRTGLDIIVRNRLQQFQVQ